MVDTSIWQNEGIALDDDTVRLAKDPSLATVMTIMPNRQPQALLTWIDTDDEHILVNTTAAAAGEDVARDPRITVLVHSKDRPWD